MGFCFCSVSIMQISECNFHRTGNPDDTCFSLSPSIIDALLCMYCYIIISIDIYFNLNKLH